MTEANDIEMTVDGTVVVVQGQALLADRDARLYFNGVLSATETSSGWRCPARRLSTATLVVRINHFLEKKGWKVKRSGIVDQAVERDLQRKRSFERTREKAAALRDGTIDVEWQTVASALRSQGWNESGRHLRPHQQRGVIHALTAAHAANFSVPGAGKTATTLAVAVSHMAAGTIEAMVVVGPLSCFAPWETETEIAAASAFSTLRVRGTAMQRRGIYESVRPGNIVLLSYATAAADKPWLIELCKRLKVMLVADESHRVKRFKGGVWAPALVEIALNASVRMVLSGTPMPQSGRDLYTQLNILWPGGELTGPRDDFATRVERNFSGLLDEIRPFLSRTPKTALGLQPYKVVRHEVPISGTQAEIYDLIEGQFRKKVEQGAAWTDKLAALKRARPIRLIQAATNPDLLNKPDSYFQIPKIEDPSLTLMDRLAVYRGFETPAKSAFALGLLDELATDGQHVVCWSNFIANLDQFAALVKSKGIPCFQVDGRVPAATQEESTDPTQEADTRERIIERFLRTEGAAVLVANPASCSESISLHSSCHRAIYLDRTYDCALFLQSIDRIHRLGLPPGVVVEVHIMIATFEGRATIDHLVDQSLLAKESTMLQLLQGAELHAFQDSEDPLDPAEGEAQDLSALLRYLLGETTA